MIRVLTLNANNPTIGVILDLRTTHVDFAEEPKR